MTTYKSDPRRHTAETAETMTDVRYEVDRIDRLLVEILAERQSFMDAAARIKGDRNIVHDRARIEDVVAKVKAAWPGMPIVLMEPREPVAEVMFLALVSLVCICAMMARTMRGRLQL